MRGVARIAALNDQLARHEFVRRSRRQRAAVGGHVLTDVQHVGGRVVEDVHLDEIVAGRRYRQRSRGAVHDGRIDDRLIRVEQHQRNVDRWIRHRQQHVFVAGEADAEFVGDVAAVSQCARLALAGKIQVAAETHRIRQHLRLCKTVVAHERCGRIVHVGIDRARRQDLNAPGQRERSARRTDVDRGDARRGRAAVVGDGESRVEVAGARSTRGWRGCRPRPGVPSPKLHVYVTMVPSSSCELLPSNVTLSGAAPFVGVTVNAGWGGTLAAAPPDPPPEPPPPQPTTNSCAKAQRDDGVERAAHGGEVSHRRNRIGVSGALRGRGSASALRRGAGAAGRCPTRIIDQ